MQFVRKFEKPIPVLVRAHQSGVWLGYWLGMCTELSNRMVLQARRVWQWEDALDCSALATVGPGPASTISPEVLVRLDVDDCVEVIEATDEAFQRLDAVEVTTAFSDDDDDDDDDDEDDA